MLRRIFIIFSLLLSALLLTPVHSAEKTVILLTVNSVINPVSAEFIEKGLEKANERNVEAIIIQLDTPGGLDTSMRKIIKAMNASNVPVIVYVSPSGARAASAG